MSDQSRGFFDPSHRAAPRELEPCECALQHRVRTARLTRDAKEPRPAAGLSSDTGSIRLVAEGEGEVSSPEAAVGVAEQNRCRHFLERHP